MKKKNRKLAVFASLSCLFVSTIGAPVTTVFAETSESSEEVVHEPTEIIDVTEPKRQEYHRSIETEGRLLDDKSSQIEGEVTTASPLPLSNLGPIPFPRTAEDTGTSIASFPRLIRLNNEGEIQSGIEHLPSSDILLANEQSSATFLNDARVTVARQIRSGDEIRFENVGSDANDRPFHAIYNAIGQIFDFNVHSQGFSGGRIGGVPTNGTFIVHFEYADGSPVEGSVVHSLGGTINPTLTLLEENMYAIATNDTRVAMWGSIDPTVLSARINTGTMNVFVPAEPHVQVWSAFTNSSVNLFDQHGPELDVFYNDIGVIGEKEEEDFVSSYKVSQRIPSALNNPADLNIRVDNPDILVTKDAEVVSIKDDKGADLSEVIEINQSPEHLTFSVNAKDQLSLRGKTIDIELKYPIDKSKNPESFLVDDYLEIDIDASNNLSSTVATDVARTWARPWGDAVPQEVGQGLTTNELDPTDFVENLENKLVGDEPFVVGFVQDKTFDTLGATSIGVIIESEISGIQNTIDVPVTVVENKGQVFVHHVDREGNPLADSEELVGRIGDTYETHPKQIEDHQLLEVRGDPTGIFTEETIEVTYVYMVAPVGPVDPMNPDLEVSPENPPVLPEDQGLISIDFVSQFNFGEVPIQAGAATYDALPQRLLNEDGTVSEEERPNYVQVSDRRAENNGWELAAKLADDGFRDASGDQLKGARILLNNTEMVTTRGNTAVEPFYRTSYILEPGNLRSLAVARNAEGSGTWIQRYGDQANDGASVTLDVPAGANPKAQLYEATIEWQLSFTPGNE